MEQIRLLIAEDHTIVREGFVSILSDYPEVCIVAEAEDGNSMVNKYFQFHPDVVLSDLNMPGMDGIAATKAILRRNENAKILFLTMYKSDEYIYKCFKTGALGMVSKDVIKHELFFAIKKVFAGEKYFMGKSEEELTVLIEKYERKKKMASNETIDSFTFREKQVLEFIAKGYKSTEIAEKLNISKRTVDATRANIMNKLNVNSLPQLIKYAVEISFKKKGTNEL